MGSEEALVILTGFTATVKYCVNSAWGAFATVREGAPNRKRSMRTDEGLGTVSSSRTGHEYCPLLSIGPDKPGREADDDGRVSQSHAE